jgi:hypothetical protein
VSDLIAKLKNGTPYKATACFVFITNYFRLLKIVLQISYNLLPKKQLALERLYCRLGVCVIYEIIRKEFFHSLTFSAFFSSLSEVVDF